MSCVDEMYPEIPVIDVSADISEEEIIQRVEAVMDRLVTVSDPSQSIPESLVNYLKLKREFNVDDFNSREIPIWWKMFLLVARNQGWTVRGWGITQSGGLFGYGLEQDDALMLMQWGSFLDGCDLMGWDGWSAKNVLWDPFKEWIGIHKGVLLARESAASAASNEPENG